MDIKWIINDKEEDILLVTGNDFPAGIMIQNAGDTIRVVLVPISPGYNVIFMDFYKDTVVAYHVESPKSQEKNYKKSETDSVYQSFIKTNPIVCRIVVAEKPQPSHIIEGYIEFEGEDFYERADNKDKKRSVKVKAYFNAGEGAIRVN